MYRKERSNLMSIYMKSKKLKLLLVLLFFSLSFVIIWGSNESLCKEKIFVYARPATKNIDPVATAGDEEVQNVLMVYDTPVTLDEKLKVIPSLAVSWEISNNYKTFTFKLRKGVHFDDGTPFNAQAFKFSFDRLLKSGLQGRGSYSDMANENSVKIIDDYTVEITLDVPYPGFITDELCDGTYSIVNPNYVKKHATADDPLALKWMSNHASGTGPFILTEWIKGERMIFEGNKNYWNKDRMPKVDKVIFRIYSLSSTARMWVEKGEVHAVEKLTPEDLRALEDNSNVSIVEIKYPDSYFLMMDVTKPPFDDLMVRKAIAYAINYEEIIQEIERGRVTRAHGVMPSGLMGYNKQPLPYRYEPKLAKQLLAQSTYPNGFTTTLRFTSQRGGSFPQIAEYIQSYLKDIGINVELLNQSLAALNEAHAQGNYGISLKNWTAGLPSPDEVGGWLYDMERGNGCWGWVGTFWYNKWAMNNMRKARSMENNAKREELYRITDALANEMAIFIPLFESDHLIAVHKSVKNFVFTPYLFARLYYAELK